MTASGIVQGGRLYASDALTLSDSTVLTQGCHVGWNFNVGTGETDLINKCGVGGGGFYFYNTLGSGSAFSTGRTLMTTITPSGGLSVPVGEVNCRVVNVGGYNLSSHTNSDGCMYRYGGNVHIVADDKLVFRDSNDNNDSSTKAYVDTDNAYFLSRQPIWQGVRLSDFSTSADGTSLFTLLTFTSHTFPSNPISSGQFVAPWRGYYDVNFVARFQDGTGLYRIEPQVNSVAQFGGDGRFYVPTDGSSNRRCLSYSDTWRLEANGQFRILLYVGNITCAYAKCTITFKGFYDGL
jgi:hypothetical protein